MLKHLFKIRAMMVLLSSRFPLTARGKNKQLQLEFHLTKLEYMSRVVLTLLSKAVQNTLMGRINRVYWTQIKNNRYYQQL